MSRAACSARVASVACSEPTCLCARPLRLRMKTSQSGVFGVAMIISRFRRGLCRRLAAFALCGIGPRGLAHPCAFIMGLEARRQPLAVARAVAREHLPEFFPVDGGVFP